MFSRLRVVELASVLAGPGVGQFFAELGADVIKVENARIGGDVTRTWKSPNEKTDDRSAYFCSVNWGKRSLAIDLTSAEGRDIIRKLLATADIVISSYKPGDDQKLGVSYDDVCSIRPDVIYGRITGYGPLNDRVGYDAVLQAESGFMDLNGDPDGPPTKMPVALIDILAAHQLKEGLLVALINKLQTGKGSFVEVSLVQAAVASLANQATNWLVGRNLPKRSGSLHPNIAPYGEWFETRDGRKVLLAIGNDRQFNELCSLLSISPDQTMGKYETNTDRVKNREGLSKLIGERIRAFTFTDLSTSLNRKHIPAGAIQNVAQVFEMKEARELMLEGEGLSGVRTFVAQMKGAESVWTPARLLPPPHLGEHNSQILDALG